MSAIRRNDRRSTRITHSSPYARQSAAKRSGWSITGLLSFLNPLKSKTAAQDEDEDSAQEDVSEGDRTDGGIMDNESGELGHSPSAAQALSIRGHQMSQSISQLSNAHAGSSSQTAFPQTPPQTQPAVSSISLNSNPNSPDGSRPSPAQNFERVSAFLAEKGDQPLNPVEVRGLMSLLQESSDHADKPEPFRFSASPSTPGRGNTPNYGFPSTVPFPSFTNGASPSPRKTLARNPNGPYRWQGGGSSRPRNRYQSPAFGSPRSAPRLKLASPEAAPKTDTKRRRVGEAAESSTPQRVPVPPTTPARAAAPSPPRNAPVPFPVANGAMVSGSTSVNGVNGISTPKVNGANLPPRLRTSTLPPKPSIPANPSPLRQTWGQGDSSSPPQASPSASRPTKAANFMAELIKEVTPPKKPDLSNPYQTASPVKPPPRKPVTRKTRASKAKESEKEKEPEPSPQAIIEATVPKGSKRSRPPANLEKSTHAESRPAATATTAAPPHHSPRQRPSDLPPVNGINGTSKGSKTSPVTVEDVIDVDENSRASKKQKRAGINGTSQPRPSSREEIAVEEVDDVDMNLTGSNPQEPTRPAEVVEPSDGATPKSAQPPAMNGFFSTGPSPSAAAGRTLLGNVKSSAPKAPSKLRFSYGADKAETDTAPSTLPTSASASAFAPVPFPNRQSSQPEPKSDSKENFDPKAAALAMDVDAVPSYTFTIGESSMIAGHSHIKAREAALAAPVSSLPTFEFSRPLSATKAFDWTAAGMKAPTAVSGGSWQCSTCMLQNAADATDKCAVCDTPRSKPVAAPASTGFNWAAAGMKQPAKPSGESWTCGTCMLSNPASATVKCTVCDTPR